METEKGQGGIYENVAARREHGVGIAIKRLPIIRHQFSLCKTYLMVQLEPSIFSIIPYILFLESFQQNALSAVMTPGLVLGSCSTSIPA